MSTAAELAASIDEGLIPVPGGRVWYRRVAGGQGVPLLLLHGGPGSPHDYLRPLEQLADERPVIFYDQLGCGRSDKPEDRSLWTLERFLEELREVRRALGLERVHLLGHSWGSMLATDHALAHPEGIVSLTLSSPCLSMARVREDMERLRKALPPALLKVYQRHEAAGTTDSGEYRTASLAFYHRHLCRRLPWPEVLQRSYSEWGLAVYNTMWGPSEFHITGNLAGYERLDSLGALKMPTLLACGRYDEITPEAVAVYQSHIPGSQAVVFEKSAHLPHLEETDRYVRVLRDFLYAAQSAAH